MRVLMTDSSGEPDIERLALPGVRVDSLPLALGRTPAVADLVAAVQTAETPVLIAWYGLPFAASTIAALAKAGVRGIVCTSVGYDKVDLIAARAAGISICHVPDYCTDEVADHALALLLWCLRDLAVARPDAVPPETWWDSARAGRVVRLQGATLALLGFGRIGQSVARRAQAFGMAVRWYDPYAPRGQEKVTQTSRVERLADLLEGASALSVHCLLSAETRGMVDATALAALPPGAVLVNTARGPVVDEQAVHSALLGGRLAAAALDVLPLEPPPDSGLFGAYLRGELPTLLLTPHTAYLSRQSLMELRRRAAAEAGRLLRGDRPFCPVV